MANVVGGIESALIINASTHPHVGTIQIAKIPERFATKDLGMLELKRVHIDH